MTEFSNDKCSICLDTITCNDNLCKTICKHSFHSSCIAKHIYKKKTDCPLCRSKLFDISKQEEEDQDNEESDDEYDVTSPDLENKELVINKIGNYLKEQGIEFKDLIQNLCFLEHEEFEIDYLQNNSDFIYGKIRYVINQNMNLLQTNSIS